MPQFFCTFPQKDSYRRNAYTIVEAAHIEDAIDEMYRIYDHGWAFAYRSAQDAGVDRHGLTYIPLGT